VVWGEVESHQFGAYVRETPRPWRRGGKLAKGKFSATQNLGEGATRQQDSLEEFGPRKPNRSATCLLQIGYMVLTSTSRMGSAYVKGRRQKIRVYSTVQIPKWSECSSGRLT